MKCTKGQSAIQYMLLTMFIIGAIVVGTLLYKLKVGNSTSNPIAAITNSTVFQRAAYTTSDARMSHAGAAMVGANAVDLPPPVPDPAPTIDQDTPEIVEYGGSSGPPPSGS